MDQPPIAAIRGPEARALAAAAWLLILLAGVGVAWILSDDYARARWRKRIGARSAGYLIALATATATNMIISGARTATDLTLGGSFLVDGAIVATEGAAVLWWRSWLRQTHPVEWAKHWAGEPIDRALFRRMVWALVWRVVSALVPVYLLLTGLHAIQL
jgi:hypothetical protein